MNNFVNIHDKLFNKTFSDPENIKTFLQIALPGTLSKRVDFSRITIDLASFVPSDWHNLFADMTALTFISSPTHTPLPTEIYILFTHQPIAQNKIFLQFSSFMSRKWQEDVKENSPLRLIIPLILYLGEKKWDHTGTFNDLFQLPPELNQFLPGTQYIFFDAALWDLTNENNRQLKDNIFQMSALLLLRSGLKKDTKTVDEIFHFWQNKGFTREIGKMIFSLSYLSAARKTYPELFESLYADGQTITLDNSHNQSTAYQWMIRGQRDGIKKGMNEAKQAIALRMLKDGMPLQLVSRYSDLSITDIKKLSN